MKRIATLLLLVICALPARASDHPRVWLDTDRGPIIVELDPSAAPITVENFLRYVDDGFYDGLIFHRVMKNFVIQSGGFNQDLVYQTPTYGPIVNEGANGLLNKRGTLAMALGQAPDSAQSQFFINLKHNDHLDGEFAVFGEVVFGMGTADGIGELATTSIRAPLGILNDYPINTPFIRRAVRTEGFPLMPGHSGSWYDANNSGVGFNVEIAEPTSGPGPIAIVYWYNFDTERPFWLTGQKEFEFGDDEVTIDLLAHNAEGTDFQQPPPPAEFEAYGSLTIRFDGCASGTFSYDLPGYGSGEIAVTALSRPVDGNCVADVEAD